MYVSLSHSLVLQVAETPSETRWHSSSVCTDRGVSLCDSGPARPRTERTPAMRRGWLDGPPSPHRRPPGDMKFDQGRQTLPNTTRPVSFTPQSKHFRQLNPVLQFTLCFLGIKGEGSSSSHSGVEIK
jgi:hypothetical protein